MVCTVTFGDVHTPSQDHRGASSDAQRATQPTCPETGACLSATSGAPSTDPHADGCQRAVNTLLGQPVAPSGIGSARCSVWVAPVESVARARMVWFPGPRSHVMRH